MAHQPLQPQLNEASSNADVIGGTLTSQPLSTFFSNQPGVVLNFDQLVDLPFLVFHPDKLVFSSEDKVDTVLFREDLFQFLWQWIDSHVHHMSLPVIALTANHFHDFDLEITLLCVKHERARGIYQVTIMPGYSAYYANDSLLPSDQRYHRILWDIEQTDSLTFNLSSPKNFAWRSRTLPGDRLMLPSGGDGVDDTVDYKFYDKLGYPVFQNALSRGF